ncbi:hypothetical protein [Persicitalea sp.]|uniref:hypothetical protein n=1 Tax=Persicitalea sp. TaxID=3100273 RepID=UPI003593E12A
METNPKKETVNEKENPEELKHVASGTPVPSGLKNEKKHKDDSRKSSEKLDQEATDEFEEHNMNDMDGYNEMPNDVPVKNKDIADEEENTSD